ncbi:MAG: F0F1 ATP synthase subunit B' [Pseudomonadota bacterium]
MGLLNDAATPVFLAAADTASAAGEAAGESGGLPQFDASTFPGQIFWLAVTFGLLYMLMSESILPRLGGMIEERKDRVADDLDKAAEFKRQADEANEAYAKGLADARAKAQAIAAETRDNLDAELSEMQAEADEKAAADVAAAEKRIAEMRDKAAEKVRDAAIDTTKAVVEALIDERPTDEAVQAAMPRG